MLSAQQLLECLLELLSGGLGSRLGLGGDGWCINASEIMKYQAGIMNLLSQDDVMSLAS